MPPLRRKSNLESPRRCRLWRCLLIPSISTEGWHTVAFGAWMTLEGVAVVVCLAWWVSTSWIKLPCSPLEFELDDGPAIEVLLSAYPGPVRVADLPHPPSEDLEDKVRGRHALSTRACCRIGSTSSGGDVPVIALKVSGPTRGDYCAEYIRGSRDRGYGFVRVAVGRRSCKSLRPCYMGD